MEGAMFSTRVSRRTLLKTGAIAVLAACLYGHEPAGDGRAEWGRRQRVARSGMI